MAEIEITEQRVNNPFTIQFSIVFWDIHDLWENTKRPFSQEWNDIWAIAADTVYDPDREKIAFCRNEFQRFQEEDGLYFLEELYKKGADPNFILALFFQYLWDKDVPLNEGNAPDYKAFVAEMRAIEVTKEACRLVLGETHEVFEYLSLVENAIRDPFIDPKDIRPNKKRPASDKQNRVIFAVCEHVRQRTGGPQWQLVFDLLKSADVIRARSYEDPHTHLKPRIKSFEKDHPKEAAYLRDRVLKTTRPYWKARAESLPPLKMSSASLLGK